MCVGWLRKSTAQRSENLNEDSLRQDLMHLRLRFFLIYFRLKEILIRNRNEHCKMMQKSTINIGKWHKSDSHVTEHPFCRFQSRENQKLKNANFFCVFCSVHQLDASKYEKAKDTCHITILLPF